MKADLIQGKNIKLRYGNKSDVGKVRERNEDYMVSFQCSYGFVFVVCDGMGGHIAGEIASRLAADTVKEFIKDSVFELESAQQIIYEAISAANSAILKRSEEDSELKGMGTTCVILIISEDSEENEIAFIGNIGDSRIYIIRSDNIYQVTKDMTYVQTLVDQGILGYEDAENHPRKNEITQALGITDNVTPEVKQISLYNDDYFVLCSDGLSGLVCDKDIYDIVKQHADPMQACEKLVDLANTSGGTDNITVQVVHMLEGQKLPKSLLHALPEGAINKSILHVGNTSRYKDNSRTRELPSIDEYQNYQNNKKKSSNSIYFGLLIIPLLVAMYFLFFAKDNTPISNNNKIEVNVSLSEKYVQDSIINFFEALYKGEDLGIEIKPPPSFCDFESFQYEIVYKGFGPKEYSLEEFISNIKDNNIIISNDSEPRFIQDVLTFDVSTEDEPKIKVSIKLIEENGKISIRSIQSDKIEKEIKIPENFDKTIPVKPDSNSDRKVGPEDKESDNVNDGSNNEKKKNDDDTDIKKDDAKSKDNEGIQLPNRNKK